MSTIDTRTLIAQLQATLRTQLERSEKLRDLPLALLQRRPDPKRWSVLEVLEHMNLSSGHYRRRLEKLYADENNGLRFRSTFTPGFWGQRMTVGMQPKENGAISWKMRTMSMFEPRTAHTTELKALDEFQEMLRGFIALLERARTRGLEGEKVVSTLGPIMRFKAGDAFRFPVAHQERHLLQIDRTLAALGTDRAPTNTTFAVHA